MQEQVASDAISFANPLGCVQLPLAPMRLCSFHRLCGTSARMCLPSHRIPRTRPATLRGINRLSPSVESRHRLIWGRQIFPWTMPSTGTRCAILKQSPLQNLSGMKWFSDGSLFTDVIPVGIAGRLGQKRLHPLPKGLGNLPGVYLWHLALPYMGISQFGRYTGCERIVFS